MTRRKNSRADRYLFIIDFCLQLYCVHFMRSVVVCVGEKSDNWAVEQTKSFGAQAPQVSLLGLCLLRSSARELHRKLLKVQ
jgi:hypothetical protein